MVFLWFSYGFPLLTKGGTILPKAYGAFPSLPKSRHKLFLSDAQGGATDWENLPSYSVSNHPLWGYVKEKNTNHIYIHIYVYMYIFKYTNIQIYIHTFILYIYYICVTSGALDMMSSPEAELKGHLRQNFLVPASLSPAAAICW